MHYEGIIIQPDYSTVIDLTKLIDVLSQEKHTLLYI